MHPLIYEVGLNKKYLQKRSAIMNIIKSNKKLEKALAFISTLVLLKDSLVTGYFYAIVPYRIKTFFFSACSP